MVQPAWVLFDCLEFEVRNRKLLQNISKYLPIDVVSYTRRLEFFQHIWEKFLGYCISVFILLVLFWYIVNILYDISTLSDIFNLCFFKHSLHSPFFHDKFLCKQVRILRYLFRSPCSYENYLLIMTPERNAGVGNLTEKIQNNNIT